MTTVEIKARIARLFPRQDVYEVDVDIIDAVNIEPALLVFRQSDDTFSHVATVYDLETWPTQPTPSRSYYRGRGAKVFYNNLTEAISFESVTRGRLNAVAKHWQDALEDFMGTEIVHITVES
jgi:hypothetical protein